MARSLQDKGDRRRFLSIPNIEEVNNDEPVFLYERVNFINQSSSSDEDEYIEEDEEEDDDEDENDDEDEDVEVIIESTGSKRKRGIEKVDMNKKARKVMKIREGIEDCEKLEDLFGNLSNTIEKIKKVEESLESNDDFKTFYEKKGKFKKSRKGDVFSLNTNKMKEHIDVFFKKHSTPIKKVKGVVEKGSCIVCNQYTNSSIKFPVMCKCKYVICVYCAKGIMTVNRGSFKCPTCRKDYF